MDTKAMQAWLDGVEGKLEGSAKQVAELKAIVFDLEQKATRPRGGSDASPSIGAQFVQSKSAELASLANGGRGRVDLSVKATLTSATGSAGALVTPQQEQVLGMPQRRLTIRSLLTVIDVSSGSVEYPRMTSRPTGAAPVAEGALKPESAMTFDLKQVPMRVIAHWIPASRQILDDEPQLRSTIDSELLYDLAVKEELQLLFGDGTGENLLGMNIAATGFAPPIMIGDANMIDKIGLGILQASLTNVPVDGVVVHPSDWWRMRLTKDSQGKYIMGDPGANVTPSLFGLPVVPTQAQAVDKFLVGGFKAQTLYDRWAARVEVSTEHADFFVRNLVAILAEERIGFAAKRPEALIYGDFGNA
jgi:HK97 family phage major capsid protein